ncbi:MAG: chorismate lyase [Pseudomonadales bacterium]
MSSPGFSKTPQWRGGQQYLASQLPRQARGWLLDEGSLTAHLVAASRGHFRVEVISQRWGTARLHEATLLDIEPRRLCLLREVFLYCNNQPWIYARSVLPEASLRRGLRHLRRFGNQPLGQLLFNDPHLRREPFELASLPATDIPSFGHSVDDSKLNTTRLLGRRSKFIVQGEVLMVSEIFLPAFWQGMAAHPARSSSQRRTASSRRN